MDNLTAVAIVKKCMTYKEKWGFWPDAMTKRDHYRIIQAFKMVDYKPGDFSFIENYGKRVALEHDYKIICRLNAWNELRNNNPLDERQFYFLHTNETVKLSLEELGYISKYGWKNYVIQNL